MMFNQWAACNCVLKKKNEYLHAFYVLPVTIFCGAALIRKILRNKEHVLLCEDGEGYEDDLIS